VPWAWALQPSATIRPFCCLANAARVLSVVRGSRRLKYIRQTLSIRRLLWRCRDDVRSLARADPIGVGFPRGGRDACVPLRTGEAAAAVGVGDPAGAGPDHWGP